VDTMTQPAPPPPPPLTPKQLKAIAKAERKFYQKKRFIIPAVLVGIAIIATAASGGGSKGGGSSNSSSSSSAQAGSADGTQHGSASGTLFPGRPDAQAKDHEANIGSPVEIVGYTATVNTAAFQPQLDSFETDGYVVANVTILNRNSGSQPYNVFDWKLQTSSGQVLDADFATAANPLHSGSLVSNGTVSGSVVFNVGAQKGDFYLIYKPKPFDASRGIWKLSI
jgi:hypothetical protein